VLLQPQQARAQQPRQVRQQQQARQRQQQQVRRGQHHQQQQVLVHPCLRPRLRPELVQPTLLRAWVDRPPLRLCVLHLRLQLRLLLGLQRRRREGPRLVQPRLRLALWVAQPRGLAGPWRRQE
jgi:hypothetical protein